MSWPPYTSDTAYRTPPPVSQSDVRLLQLLMSPQFGVASLSVFVALHRGKKLSASILDHCIRMNNREAFELLLRDAELQFEYCAPVRVAVEKNDIYFLRALIAACHEGPNRFDLNTGCPLRVAVVSGNYEALTMLLNDERINPNRGVPLYYAVMRGDLPMVRRIAGHPKTAINRLTPVYGTTPLCCAIEEQFDDIVTYLLSHPRVDVNRGFLYSPLELCIKNNRPRIVHQLLEHPELVVTHCIGKDECPLELALRLGHAEVVRALLADARCEVPDGLVNELEMQHDVDTLQLIAQHKGVKIGWRWTCRILLLLSALLLICAQTLLDLPYVNLSPYAPFISGPMLVPFIHVASSVVSVWLLLWKTSPGFIVGWRIVPFVPVFDGLIFLRMINAGAAPDLRTREKLYCITFWSHLGHTASLSIPLLIMQISIFVQAQTQHVAVPFAASTLVCCLDILKVCVLYALRCKGNQGDDDEQELLRLDVAVIL